MKRNERIPGIFVRSKNMGEGQVREKKELRTSTMILNRWLDT
jgi:hypothetical protein